MAEQPSGDRRSISKRLRFEILRRDDYACRYCGAKAPDAKLTIDHVQPVALGGGDEPANLVTACAECNAGKSSSAPDAPIVENVADDALRWSKAMERAAQIDRKAKGRIRPIVKAVDEEWKKFTTYGDEYLPRPSDWRTNIETFATQGLNKRELVEAVQITMAAKGVENANLWRYFCGIGWRKIRERQEVARALLEAGDES